MIKLLLIISLFIYQNNSDSIVEQLQNKFENINFLQADFMQSAGGTNSLSGKFYFAKENNYRIELTNNTIISDGSSIWNIDNRRKKVIISNVDEDPFAFSITDYIYNYPSKCEVTEEDLENGYLIIFSGEKTDLNFKIANLHVDENFFITKIQVFDFAGNSFTLNFNNIKIKDDINYSLFTFENESNHKLIDLR